MPDLLEQDFTATAPNRKMVGDITYIPTWEGWLFLATVIDCHTKMVICYALGEDYKTGLIQDAPRRSTDDSSTSAAPPSASATSPTTSPGAWLETGGFRPRLHPRLR